MAAEIAMSWSEIDQFVEAFERSHALDGQADIARFLPAKDHPLYATVFEELLRVDLELSWRSGQPKKVEDFIRRFPSLRTNAALLQSLIFEERRLRLQAGEVLSEAENQQRFDDLTDTKDDDVPAPESLQDPPIDRPGFPDKTVEQLVQFRPPSFSLSASEELPGTSLQSRAYAEVLQEIQTSSPRAVGRLAQAVTNLPCSGQELLGYRLLEELGRGAFGRVFLAREKELAQRLVVLKIAPNLNEESQALAQLQHTNIVPILSLHRAGLFQIISMPYHGDNTLAQVLEALRAETELPKEGTWLTRCLEQRRRKITGAPPHPAVVDFHKTSYVHAVLWLAERMAEGLGHAHACGIRHYDLKPANILLADSGEPMLLDFNQAEDTKRPGGAARAFVGGTLPYMAPEHLLSMRDGHVRMDDRSDIYSLGLILFELLTGKYPFPLKGGTICELLDFMLESRHGPPPSARAYNPAVSLSEDAILKRCLAPEPRERYQHVHELKEDLELHRNHLPLRHAPNPSMAERVRKWVRRHPRLASSYSVVAIAIILLSTLGVGFYLQGKEFARTQEQKEVLAANEVFQKFTTAFNGCRYRLIQPELPEEDLREGLRLGSEALEYYQPYLTADGLQTAGLRLNAEQIGQLRQLLPELLFYLSQAEIKDAKNSQGSRRLEKLARGERYHHWAVSLPGSQEMGGSLLKQESDFLRERGDTAQAAQLDKQWRGQQPRSARDYTLQAFFLMGEGRYRDALKTLEIAQDLEPKRQTLWMLGLCHYGLNQHDKAVLCFSPLIAMEPNNFLAFYARGRSRHGLQDYAGAIADYDAVLRLQPRDMRVVADRAVARMEAKQWQAALGDLNTALAAGLDHTRLYTLRAIVKQQLGDAQGAAADQKKFLETTPTDEQSWIARARARMASDPRGALADLDEALKARDSRHPAIALENKANILSDILKDDAAALVALNEALKLAPESVRARAGRGVLLARMGKRAEALADAQEALRLDPSPFIIYQVAGIYALTSKTVPQDKAEAYRLLATALSAGTGFEYLAADPELKVLRQEPEFRKLTDAAGVLRQFLQPPPGRNKP